VMTGSGARKRSAGGVDSELEHAVKLENARRVAKMCERG
jgi:hypothetical protein